MTRLTDDGLNRILASMSVAPDGPLGTCHALPVNLISPSIDELIERIAAYCDRGGGVVSYAHIETVYILAKGGENARILSSVDAMYPDGIGAQIAFFVLDGRWRTRITADDFVRPIVRLSGERGWNLALIGSRGDHSRRTAELLRRSGASTISFALDGYAESCDRAMLAHRIREAGVRLLLLGLGQPRQEGVARELASACPGLTVICVGGLFDVFREGSTARKWLRRSGLEWTQRLLFSPIQLFPRYLLHPWSVLLWAVRQRLRGPKVDVH